MSGTAMDGLTHGVDLLKSKNCKKCATFFHSHSKNKKTNAWTKWTNTNTILKS